MRSGEVDSSPNVCKKNEVDLFGVFDGHNGYRGSLFARENLLQNIQEHLPEDVSADDAKKATHDAYLR